MDELPNVVHSFEYNVDLAALMIPDGGYDLQYPSPVTGLPRWRAGVLFRWGSFWIGGHYAAHHKRLCVNLVPFVTIWVTAPGGDVP
jgi:hypothetical protein